MRVELVDKAWVGMELVAPTRAHERPLLRITVAQDNGNAGTARMEILCELGDAIELLAELAVFVQRINAWGYGRECECSTCGAAHARQEQ